MSSSGVTYWMRIFEVWLFLTEKPRNHQRLGLQLEEK
jgi:hypothetical protein